MKLYISGPITGQADDNRTAFKELEQYLLQEGHVVVNPLEVEPHVHLGKECPPGRTNSGHLTSLGELMWPFHRDPCYLRGDIAAMLTCDAVIVLEGWVHSTGSRLEVNVAMECGLPVYFPTFHPSSPIIILQQLGSLERMYA